MCEHVLDHSRGGVRKMLPSAIAEADVVSIISIAGGLREGGGGEVVGDDGGALFGASSW